MKKLIAIAAVLCLALLSGCAAFAALEEPVFETTAPITTTELTTTTLPPTTEPPTTLPLVAPALYRAAPEAYWPVLSWFYRVAYAQRPGNENGWYYFPDMFQTFGRVFGYNNWPMSDMGYAIVDINNDGTPELLLLTRDGVLFAIYTLSDGAPVRIASGDRGGATRLAADGTLHVLAPCGCCGNSLTISRLEPGASAFTQIAHEADVWEAEWPEPMPFDFIPIEQ